MAGRAVERFDVGANTQEIIDHYLTCVGLSRRAPMHFSFNSFIFTLASEAILFGFFWGATLINKLLAVTMALMPRRAEGFARHRPL